MTEDEQREYQAKRERECWQMASIIAAFMCENFVAEERQAAWNEMQRAIGVQVRMREMGERVDGVGEARH